MQDTLKDWLKKLKLNESTISMLLGALVVIVVGVMLYSYFVVSEEETTEEPKSEEYVLELEEEEGGEIVPQGLPSTHKVATGEHLWMISEKYYGNGYNWIDIANKNNIINPNIIEKGQELTIPKVKLRVPIDIDSVSAEEKTNTHSIEADYYTVVKGDTLWSIAVRSYQDGYQWPEIFNANKEIISNPNIIEVGMEITLPR